LFAREQESAEKAEMGIEMEMEEIKFGQSKVKKQAISKF
jgi:hypothetical protein